MYVYIFAAQQVHIHMPVSPESEAVLGSVMSLHGISHLGGRERERGKGRGRGRGREREEEREGEG